MKKILFALFPMLFFTACVGVQTPALKPVDAEVAADLPVEVALAWLEKVPATHPPYRNSSRIPPPPCHYNETGIDAYDQKIKLFSQWYVDRSLVFSDSYEWKLFVEGFVMLKSGSSFSEGCYAYFQRSNVEESDIPSTMKSVQLDVEKTLTALASLGVKVD